MGRKEKPRTMAERNRRLCGSICLCQLTVVLSCVALIYLSVAIYTPSHRAFHSGFEPGPVMCQTIRTTLANNCAWASCGEWCLTKTTGFCPQITVTVRRNSSVLWLENCTKPITVSCPPANPTSVKRYNCNLGSECTNLNGVFNCSLGHCGNMSELFLCHHKADGITVFSSKDNMKLNGFFECKRSRCTRIRRPFSCDRYCDHIPTETGNVFVLHEDSVLAADCKRALAAPPDETTPPREVWRSDATPDGTNASIFFVSCMSITQLDNGSYQGVDCLNGSLLDMGQMPKPNINFTTLWSLVAHALATRLVDASPVATTTSTATADGESAAQLPLLPPLSSLTIYNQSRLYINLEGCVNTLRGECLEFVTAYGRDGSNQTAPSRFPCFYNKKDSFMAVARFDLNKTLRELLIASLVPSVLFVVSFATLVAITKFVKVGDDGRMRCTMCDHCRGVATVDTDDDVLAKELASAPPGADYVGEPLSPAFYAASAPPMDDWCASTSDDEIFVPLDMGTPVAHNTKADVPPEPFDPTLIIVTPADD